MSNEAYFNLVDLIQRRLRDKDDEDDPELRDSSREPQPQGQPLSDTSERPLIKRSRCPYCHDDIVPGGENQACHECLAWHHRECWTNHGACVGCGNEWVAHGTSGKSRPAKVTHIGDFHPTMDEIRALAGLGAPKKPPCKHKFNPMDNRCDYCHEALETIAAKEFGAHRRPLPGTPKVDFAKEKLANRQRDTDARRRKRHREVFAMVVMAVAFLLGLLHTILTSAGYIPS